MKKENVSYNVHQIISQIPQILCVLKNNNVQLKIVKLVMIIKDIVSNVTQDFIILKIHVFNNVQKATLLIQMKCIVITIQQ